MKLIGVGHQILATVPFAVGVAANLAWPSVFRMELGAMDRILGIIVLSSGLALYIASLLQVLVNVPRDTLITTGPFAVVRHPLYCAVSLLMIPGVGLLLDSWLGFVLGAVMYLAMRPFRGMEETHLAATSGMRVGRIERA